MESNCKHDFGRKVFDNAKTTATGRSTRRYQQRHFSSGKDSFVGKNTQCKNAPPAEVVIAFAADTASNLRGILKPTTDTVSNRRGALNPTTATHSFRGQPARRENVQKRSRHIWHLDDLKVHGYGYYVHRELEAFLVPTRSTLLEHDKIEPVVRDFFRIFADSGNATSPDKTVHAALSAEHPNSADMQRDSGNRSKRGRRNRRRNNATKV